MAIARSVRAPTAAPNRVAPPPSTPLARDGVAAIPPAAAGRWRPLAAATGAVPPVRRRPPRGGLPGAARVLRRQRTPWPRLSRVRLAAAWAAVQRDHGGPGADLRLVGVYGPLPLAAVAAAALEPDGGLRVAVGPRRAAAHGDIALARDAATGRLVRADAPYADALGDGRELRYSAALRGGRRLGGNA